MTTTESQELPDAQSQSLKHQESSTIRSWRLWLPLTFQVFLVCAVAAPSLYTELNGKTVILKTVPVDPYDPLRGYSQTLSYDISGTNNLKNLPGWKQLPKEKSSWNSKGAESLKSNTVVYVILQRSGVETNAEPPKAWQPVKLQRDRPTNLPENQVAIRGIVEYGRVKYGLETYYVPEEISEQINAEVKEATRKNFSAVEVKVNSEGRAVPIKLWLGKQSYRF